MEHVLLQPNTHEVVDKYVAKCKELGFYVLECSTGFLSIPPDDFVRLVEKVEASGLKAKT
jgi:phosphosulfolactate synthase (CoM biosynthesis protein A)